MTIKNTFNFFELCKPSARCGSVSSDADVLSSCNPNKDNPKQIIWRMSFSEKVIKDAGFTPGLTRLVFTYNEGVVTLFPNKQGRLLSKASGKTSRPRIRFALPREISGYINRGALPEVETEHSKIHVTMI